MSEMIDVIVNRQEAIAKGSGTPLALPKFDSYVVCNLRGGIGKTSLVFNLSYSVDDLLVVDTCPQGNLSYFYDGTYYNSSMTSVADMILPHIIGGLGAANGVARSIGASNSNFNKKNSYFIPSSGDLYTLPSQMANALVQARTLNATMQQGVIDNILFSLKKEVVRERAALNLTKCLIDTSPFFSGATHLAWHAADALIVPVRTDQQSINSFELLLKTLSSPSGEFLRTPPSNQHSPKIQLVVLTHCGWSTKAGARNVPNQQTKMFLERVRDIVARHIVHFTTSDPDNHIVLLDDFLGCGRMSTAKSKPIELLKAGDKMVVNRVKTTVNESVTKIQNQIKFISQSIW